MDTARWEYCLVDLVISNYRSTGDQVRDWLDHLNQLGDEGWEAIADTTLHAQGWTGNQWPIMLMKRQKQTQ